MQGVGVWANVECWALYAVHSVNHGGTAYTVMSAIGACQELNALLSLYVAQLVEYAFSLVRRVQRLYFVCERIFLMDSN